MRLAALAAVALVTAGCAAGGEAGAGAETAAPTRVAAVREHAAAEPGSVLRRFVAAARRGDVPTMWTLLSAPSRAGYGGSLFEFRGGAANDLRRLLGGLAGERLLVSRRIGDRWAVAAIAGRRTVSGETDDFSYAAALVRERGAWKVDVGGAVISGLSPEPLEDVGARPRLEVDVSGAAAPAVFRLWLDGEAVDARRDRVGAFSASFSGRPRAALSPGRHDAVAFAATRDAAVATAWPFTVTP